MSVGQSVNLFLFYSRARVFASNDESNGKFFTFFKRKPKARTRNKPSRNDGMHHR